MERSRARELASGWGVFADREIDDPLRIHEMSQGYESAKAAVFREIADRLPDSVVAAVIQDEGKNPRIGAVDLEAEAVYLIGFESYAGSDGIVRDDDLKATCRIIGLDPARASVDISTYRSSQFGTTWRWSRWQFDLGVEKLVFTSQSHVDEEAADAERFANALCTALGWAARPSEVEKAA